MAKVLIGAQEHEWSNIQRIVMRLFPNWDFDFETNRWGVINKASSNRYDIVAIDYNLGELIFIQELMSGISTKDLCVFNVSGWGTTSNVESACKGHGFELTLLSSTDEFLDLMAKVRKRQAA